MSKLFWRKLIILIVHVNKDVNLSGCQCCSHSSISWLCHCCCLLTSGRKCHLGALSCLQTKTRVILYWLLTYEPMCNIIDPLKLSVVNFVFSGWAQQGFWGFDFRDGVDLDRSANGSYSTELFAARAEKIIHNHDTNQVDLLYNNCNMQLFTNLLEILMLHISFLVHYSEKLNNLNMYLYI